MLTRGSAMAGDSRAWAWAREHPGAVNPADSRLQKDRCSSPVRWLSDFDQRARVVAVHLLFHVVGQRQRRKEFVQFPAVVVAGKQQSVGVARDKRPGMFDVTIECAQR